MSKYRILAELLSRLGLDKQSVASSRAEAPEPTTSVDSLTEREAPGSTASLSSLAASFDREHPPLMPPPPFPVRKLCSNTAPKEASNEILGGNSYEDGDPS